MFVGLYFNLLRFQQQPTSIYPIPKQQNVFKTSLPLLPWDALSLLCYNFVTLLLELAPHLSYHLLYILWFLFVSLYFTNTK